MGNGFLQEREFLQCKSTFFVDGAESKLGMFKDTSHGGFKSECSNLLPIIMDIFLNRVAEARGRQ